jgi:hypothetical protein
MAAHKGPASSRPRCTRSGSSVATIPVYHTSCFTYSNVGIWNADLNVTFMKSELCVRLFHIVVCTVRLYQVTALT